ncbi:MAG: helicase [Firmicutes bacterium]|nr:helicase [Bacillota bacterium]
MHVITTTIPELLKTFPHWVCYTEDKIPIDPKTGRSAKANDAVTWADFDTAKRYAATNGLGIGFQFGTSERLSGIVGVDIDKCINPETGQFSELAMEIIEMFPNCYVEISPSGTGIHILVGGRLPDNAWHKIKELGMETYDRYRYFTVTGNMLPGASCSVRHCQSEIDALCKRYFSQSKVAPVRQEHPRSIADITEHVLLNKILQSKQGRDFQALWNGDTSKYSGDDSAADLALCNILAFWTGCDLNRMDAFFRQSGLYRQKWEREDYRMWTLQKAINDCHNTYGDIPIIRGTTTQGVAPAEPLDPPSKYRFFSFTDLGNAERFIYYYGTNIRYCPELKLFLVWDGKRWLKDVTGEIDRMAFKAVRAIKEDIQHLKEPKAVEACLAWAKSSESRTKLLNMVELAKVQPGVPISINETDQNKYYVNCLNGTIDLTSGELLPHNKEHKITHILPFEYKPYQTGQAMRWVQFLCEVTDGNLELMTYLWKLAGLCLSGNTSEHVLHILYGSKGRNGKGVFIGILQEILGELTCVLPFSTFEPKNCGGIPNDIAAMAGKRLVIAQESNEGKRLDEAVIKSLTGGDMLTGRFLRAEFFQFKPTHKILMSTNNKPMIRETSNSIWSRLRLIPFEVSFEGREDKRLDEKLRQELPEIFAWCVAGFAEWQREGLHVPDAIKRAGAEYRKEEDVVQNFITECCFISADASASAKEMHECFIEWATKNGEKALSQRVFNKRLKEREFRDYTSSGFMRFKGIGLLDFKRVSTW